MNRAPVLPDGCTSTPCVDCGQPITIYPPEDGNDTRWRCGRCGRTAVATLANETSAGPTGGE